MRAGFWLQHGNRDAESLVAYADDLALQPGGRPGVVLAPVNSSTKVNALFQQARSKGDAFLDPVGHSLDRDPTKRSKDHFPWLVQSPRPDTKATWKAWMERGVAHQLSAELRGTGQGPTAIVTPSPIVTAAAGQEELYTILDAAAEIRSDHKPQQDLWLGLAVDRVHIRENPHLTRLGNAVVASGVPGLVLRAFHSELPPIQDRRYLEGLREITYAAYAGDIDLMLPHSGWLGWLAMAWGAWGFSGGFAAGSWGDREPGPMNSPDEPANPYFEPQLLRTVRWRVHEELQDIQGYEPCTCPECSARGNSYDAALVKRHQMWWANEEAARLVPLDRAGRAVAAAGRLDAAIAFRGSLDASLQDRVKAGFLDTWRNLI